MITEKERQALAAKMASFIYNFFRDQEPVATLEGNRRAAEKAALVAGRVTAAVMHEGKLDGEYLIYSRWLERQTAEVMRSTLDEVVSGSIKAVD